MLCGGSCPQVLERGFGDMRISLWALSFGIHRSECVVGALVRRGCCRNLKLWWEKAEEEAPSLLPLTE